MQNWRRRCCDRRSGGERRQKYSLDYFAAGGVERRGGPSQRKRKGGEKRKNWVRVDLYSSAYCGWDRDQVDGGLDQATGEGQIFVLNLAEGDEEDGSV